MAEAEAAVIVIVKAKVDTAVATISTKRRERARTRGIRIVEARASISIRARLRAEARGLSSQKHVRLLLETLLWTLRLPVLLKVRVLTFKPRSEVAAATAVAAVVKVARSTRARVVVVA